VKNLCPFPGCEPDANFLQSRDHIGADVAQQEIALDAAGFRRFQAFLRDAGGFFHDSPQLFLDRLVGGILSRTNGKTIALFFAAVKTFALQRF
jgi:hypothetical protein